MEAGKMVARVSSWLQCSCRMQDNQPSNPRAENLAVMGSIPPARRAGDCAPYHWLWLVACGLAAFAFGCAAPSEGRKAAVSQARTYTNPVYSGSMPDPSVIRYQGFY
jgi:hypothetical protein